MLLLCGTKSSVDAHNRCYFCVEPDQVLMLPLPEPTLVGDEVAGEDVVDVVTGVLLVVLGLEPVSLVTPSAVVTVPEVELEEPGEPVLPVSKESVPTMPPLLPVPASFSRAAGLRLLFLLITPFQAFQYTEAPYRAVLD